MSVNSVSTATSAAAAAATAQTAAADPNEAIGREAFMKLLVQQLKNQDPLNPMDSREFVTQLSQLTSVEQMISMNKGIEALGAGMGAMYNTQLASVVGKSITASTDGTESAMSLGATGNATAPYEITTDAASVTVQIVDSSGRVVRTAELSDIAAGEQTFTWDGLDDSGARAAAGNYTMKVMAKDAEGEDMDVIHRVQGVVDGVEFGSDGTIWLTIGETKVTPADIISIHN